MQDLDWPGLIDVRSARRLRRRGDFEIDYVAEDGKRHRMPRADAWAVRLDGRAAGLAVPAVVHCRWACAPGRPCALARIAERLVATNRQTAFDRAVDTVAEHLDAARHDLAN